MINFWKPPRFAFAMPAPAVLKRPREERWKTLVDFGKSLDPGPTCHALISLLPSRTARTWQTLASQSFDINVTGWGGYGMRQQIATTAFAAFSNSGTAMMRLTLTPPTTGSSTIIIGSYCGNAGAAPNFVGTQVPVLVAGNSTFTLTAGGAAAVSDAFSVPFNPSTALVISYGFGATTDTRGNNTASSAFTLYFKAADAANFSTTTVSGYSTLANAADVTSKIEILV